MSQSRTQYMDASKNEFFRAYHYTIKSPKLQLRSVYFTHPGAHPERSKAQ